MSGPEKTPLLLSFYGDDFTGTTAMAEALTVSGVPTLMFTEPPSLPFLKDHFPRVQAIGVTGISRSLPTQTLERVLKPIFQKMKLYQVPLFLYKVCSTFDSSPEWGSIGRAIEIGRKVFPSSFVPILAAAPQLGRFTVFGHHFAALGKEVFRLDRHPSVSAHPVTPMRESDLILHLSKQTGLQSGLVTLLELDKGKKWVEKKIHDLLDCNVPMVLFDTFSNQHLRTACSVIWDHIEEGKTLFSVGSQEMGFGLAETWKRLNLIHPSRKRPSPLPARKDEPVLIVSGSCASMTGRQIEWARGLRYEDIAVEPERLLTGNAVQSERMEAVDRTVSALKQGRSVIIHSAIGPTDPRIARTQRRMKALGVTPQRMTDLLGEALGEMTKRVIMTARVRRVVLAGGDTSGRIIRALGIRALQVAAPVGIAAPLCYAYSSQAGMAGLEISLKGGQIGQEDYFEKVRIKRILDFSQAALGGIRKRS